MKTRTGSRALALAIKLLVLGSFNLAPGLVDAGAGILVEAKAGGKNPARFCEPSLTVKNNTGKDIAALLVQLEWKDRKTGAVLQPVGTHGTLIENLAAGRSRSPFAAGHPVDCRNLELSIRTYACRDANAVRTQCPAGIVAQADGGIVINDSEMKEGRMRGAVEP